MRTEQATEIDGPRLQGAAWSGSKRDRRPSFLPSPDRPQGRPDTMIYWLAQALSQLRRQADPPIKQVEIAALAGVDQSTIWRLEEERAGWPRQVELIVAAYAEECGVDDPRDIWAFATDLWRQHGDRPSVRALSGRIDAVAPPEGSTSPIDAAREAFEQTLADRARAHRRAGSST